MPDYSNQLSQIIGVLNNLAPTAVEQCVSIISAIAASLAAFAGLWAANAASRSAHTAKDAAENVQKIARLGILRDVSTTAYEVISEYERVKSLVDDIKIQIKTLSRHAGQGRNSSAEKEITEKAESVQREIAPLEEEAQELVQKRPTLLNASEEALMHDLTKFVGYLTRARRVGHELEREANSLITQNQVYFSTWSIALHEAFYIPIIALLRVILPRIWDSGNGLQTDACSFANLPERKSTQRALTKEEMKKRVSLKPECSPKSSSPRGRRMVT